MASINLPVMNIKKVVNYLVIFTVFSEALTLPSTSFFEIRTAYFLIFIFSILMLRSVKSIYFSKNFIFVICLFIIFSLLNVYWGNNDMLHFLKQIFGITVYSLFFYSIVKLNKEDVDGLFMIYLRVAFFVGLIGIVQEIGYFIKIQKLYDFSYILPKWHLPLRDVQNFFRVNSIMPEPSAFCIAMMPAFFFSVNNLLKERVNFSKFSHALTIILPFLFTLSSIGYIGIFLTVIILTINNPKPRLIILALALIISISAVIYFIPEIRLRLSDTWAIIKNESGIGTTNLSTFTLIANFKVTLCVLRDNLIFGHGLGSHEISYYRYLPKVIDLKLCAGQILLNEKDANSLALRILSETGFMGLIIFLTFMISNFIPRARNKSNQLWLINNSIMIFFVLRLLRQGNYFSEGFFFFFWLYYFTKKHFVNEYPD